MPYINTVQEFGAVLKQGPYAWPGGYPIYFMTEDGAYISFANAWKERAGIARAIIDKDKSSGWRVVGYDVNWEDPELFDDHTGSRIESAYAEDDAVGEIDPIPKSYSKWYRRVHGIAPTVRGPKIIRDLDGFPNGKAKGKRVADFDIEQLRRGAAVEREHTSDPKIAQRIAMDHLVEDPRYYEKLAKIHLDGLRTRRRAT